MTIGIKELLEAGVHFGHQTRRWNPKMKRFIFEARNGIHIIDLSQTATQLQAACNFLENAARQGQNILFIGTKKQAQSAVRDAAVACGAMHVTERWLGGTLTNLSTVRRSIERMNEIERMEADGSLARYGKQEQSMIRREHARLKKNLDGIRTLQKQPDVIFIVDVKREHNAVAEGRRLGVPIVAIVDTNCDPDLVDHPIAGNDDAIRSLRLILATVTDAIARGRAEYEAKYARKKDKDAAPEAAPAPAPEPAAEPTAPAAPVAA